MAVKETVQTFFRVWLMLMWSAWQALDLLTADRGAEWWFWMENASFYYTFHFSEKKKIKQVHIAYFLLSNICLCAFVTHLAYIIASVGGASREHLTLFLHSVLIQERYFNGYPDLYNNWIRANLSIYDKRCRVRRVLCPCLPPALLVLVPSSDKWGPLCQNDHPA